MSGIFYFWLSRKLIVTLLVASCAGDMFRCSSGECIKKQERCNGRQDCRDGSDEACGCAEYCTGHSEYRCNDNFCLSSLDKDPRCDGQFQCPDLSDEFSCPSDSCKSDEWQCGTGLCIPDIYRCDGLIQCPDLSDEVSCGCGQGEFRCDSGECVDTRLRCDGADQCQDGSDEAKCKT